MDLAAKKITIPVAKMDKESANKYRYAGLPPIDGIYVLKSAFEGKPPASATLGQPPS